MESKLHDTGSKLLVRIPITIAYPVIEAYMKKTQIGEIISTEKDGKSTNYAEIIDIWLDNSLEEGFDVAVEVKVKTLTKLFSGREATVILHANIDFNYDEQQVMVTDFKIDSKAGNWILNNTMETIANNFLHSKIKDKMKFDFTPEIEKQLRPLNNKLSNQMEVHDGVFLGGNLSQLDIVEFLSTDTHFIAWIQIEGSTALEIKKITKP